MNLQREHFAEFFRSDYYTVDVVFEESAQRNPQLRAYNAQDAGIKQYTYKVPKSLTLSVGDRVIVAVKTDDQTKLKIVNVSKVHSNIEVHADSGFKYKWVVGKYDTVMADYNTNVEKDNKLKVAVGKLEAALSRVSLKKRIAEAMVDLDQDTKAELLEAFGADIMTPAIEGK